MDANELLNLLESNDLKVVSEVKSLIKENLQQNREAWLLNGLVESYVVSHSQQCAEILAGVEEPHDKHLFDRLVELLKGNVHRLIAVTLLLHLACRQPPWLHKLVSHPLLSVFLKCMKTGNDAPVLMTGSLVLTTILPVIPVSVSSHLQDILDVFSRLAAFTLRKPGGNISDVYLLHLQVGVYALFHRLYGMYPCHFLTYMRAHYSKKDNQAVFKEVIRPMLERVRMHPLLVTSSSEKEVSKDRWRQKEVHDIIVDCAKLSLDLIEGSCEEALHPSLMESRSNARAKVTSPRSAGSSRYGFGTESSSVPPSPAAMGPPGLSGTGQNITIPLAQSKDSPIGKMFDTENLWSPANLCGLSTPPPVSTTGGATEGTSSRPASHQGTSTNTPSRNSPTQPPWAESPLSHSTGQGEVEMDKCDSTSKNQGCYQSQPSSANVTPLLSPQKRLSAISLSLAGRSLLTSADQGLPGDCSVPPSPLKPEFTAEPPLSARRMSAIRRIAFDSQENPQVAEEAQEAVEAPSGGFKIPKPPADIAKRETSPLAITSTTESMPVAIATAKGQGQESSKGQVGSQGSTPSLSQLPSYIDSLGVHEQDLNQSDEVDPEVLALTTSEDKGAEKASKSREDEESSDASSSNLAANSEETMESVKAFMKQINRIRFNTYNPQRERKGVSKSTSRPNSCPDLQQDALEDEEDLALKESEAGVWIFPSTSVPQTSVALPDVVASGTSVTSIPTKSNDIVAVASASYLVPSLGPSASSIESSKSVPAELEQHNIPAAPGLPFISWCPNCLKQTVPRATDAGATRPKENEAPFFSTFSPPDLLDRHIAQAREVHAQELSRFQLTSQGSVSWTHFGGVPPADEVQLLRSQLILLHNQLMFERHKRELHAKRNRRLLGRIVKTKALEEQNTAMQDQLRLQENEIQNLSISLRLQQELVSKLKNTDDANKQEREIQQKSFLQEIEILHGKQKDLKAQLEAEKRQCDLLSKELQSCKARVFELEQETKSLRDQANLSQQLKDQIARLNKELLLMGELQQLYQQRLASVSLSHQPRQEMTFILDTYKAEVETQKVSLDQKTVLLDATKTKLVEAEEMIKQKDIALGEQKKLFEEMKMMYKGERSALEEKYNAQKKIQLTLQAQLLDVHSRLGQTQRPVLVRSEGGSTEYMAIPTRGDSVSDVIPIATGSVSIDTQTSPTLERGIMNTVDIACIGSTTTEQGECSRADEVTPAGALSDLDASVMEAKEIPSDPGSDMTISSASEA